MSLDSRDHGAAGVIFFVFFLGDLLSSLAESERLFLSSAASTSSIQVLPVMRTDLAMGPLQILLRLH